jgi:RimJ/RimL family protein N-acetyltransferase
VSTGRLLLRPFEESDLAPFAALNVHPRVVEALGSAPTRAQSDALVERYGAELEREGWGFWAVEVVGGAHFIGMVGLHAVHPTLPCAPGVEAGWRLHPDWWGHGYATEAAAASLHYGFTTGGLNDIVAFTAAVNLRSQAVMERIGMVRQPDGDFDHPGVAEGSPLKRHVLYRATPGHTGSHLPRTLIR